MRKRTLANRASQWMWVRLVTVCFMWTDLLYLTCCTLVLKALACYPGPSSLRLGAENAQICFTNEHMPIFLASVVIYVVLCFYPFVIHETLKHGIPSESQPGANFDRDVWLAASMFMVKTVHLEWKPLRASYRFFVRNMLAVVSAIPIDISYVALMVAFVYLADSAFIVIKRPFTGPVSHISTHTFQLRGVVMHAHLRTCSVRVQ
jgi:hypothetical protein